MRDMNPRGDRSIRNIPVSNTHRRAPVQQQEQEIDEDFVDDMPRPPKRSARGPLKIVWWIVGTIVVCGLAGLIVSTIFQGAQITVTPRTETVTPPATLPAEANAPVGSLGYQTMSVSQSASTTVAASGVEQVSKQASGAVVIYNTYSAASQALVANTRFEAPDGKIYRIHQAVTVPGTTKKSDGTIVPGSVTTTIYADAAGAEYNKGSTKFTIPGFKTDPRYSKFYAQSQGSISGGLVGQQPAVAPAALAAGQKLVKEQLDVALRAAAAANLPEGFLLVEGSLSTVYEAPVQTKNSDTAVTLSQSAVSTAVIVKAEDLAKAVAKQTVQNYNDEPVTFADLAAARPALSSANQGSEILILTLGGSADLVWLFDTEAVKKALLGREKAAFETIIKSFKPAIVSAEANIRPFWKATFPTDPTELHIKIAR